jgi:HK97 family phage prohead protease
MNNKETRFQVLDKEQSLRSIESEDGKRYLEGYAILFNKRSKLIFEDGEVFNEVIEPRAVEAALKDGDVDILYTYQHNMNAPMARYNPSKDSETLTYEVDEIGVRFKAEVPDTSLGRDTWELVKRGVLYETSFIFTVDQKGQRWSREEDGGLLRTITGMTGIYDFSTVVRAAYDGTTTKLARAEVKELIPEEKKEKETKEKPKLDKRQKLLNDITLRVHGLK